MSAIDGHGAAQPPHAGTIRVPSVQYRKLVAHRARLQVHSFWRTRTRHTTPPPRVPIPQAQLVTALRELDIGRRYATGLTWSLNAAKTRIQELETQVDRQRDDCEWWDRNYRRAMEDQCLLQRQLEDHRQRETEIIGMGQDRVDAACAQRDERIAQLEAQVGLMHDDLRTLEGILQMEQTLRLDAEERNQSLQDALQTKARETVDWIARLQETEARLAQAQVCV